MEIQQRRSSTSATWRAVGRYMAKRLTWGPTCAGTRVRGHLSVTGSSVARGSPGVTSYRDTDEHTQVNKKNTHKYNIQIHTNKNSDLFLVLYKDSLNFTVRAFDYNLSFIKVETRPCLLLCSILSSFNNSPVSSGNWNHQLLELWKRNMSYSCLM